jgi:hypothetical protein
MAARGYRLPRNPNNPSVPGAIRVYACHGNNPMPDRRYAAEGLLVTVDLSWCWRPIALRPSGVWDCPGLAVPDAWYVAAWRYADGVWRHGPPDHVDLSWVELGRCGRPR